jgi:hypothetical protein
MICELFSMIVISDGKPKNILVGVRNGAFLAYLPDFGTAKRFKKLTDERTASGWTDQRRSRAVSDHILRTTTHQSFK